MRNRCFKTALSFFSGRKLAILLAATLMLGLLTPFSSAVSVRADEPTYTHAVSVFAVDSVGVGTPAFAGNYRRDGITIYTRSDHGGGNTISGGNSSHGFIKFDFAGSGIDPATIGSITLRLQTTAFTNHAGWAHFSYRGDGQLEIVGVDDASWIREGEGQVIGPTSPIRSVLPAGNHYQIPHPLPGITPIQRVDVPAPAGSAITTDVTDFVLSRLHSGYDAFSIGVLVAGHPRNFEVGDPPGYVMDGDVAQPNNRVNTHVTLGGHLNVGGAPRLYVELTGLTAVEVMEFAQSTGLQSEVLRALETIGALAEPVIDGGWSQISPDVGMRHNVLMDMLGRTFVDRADIISQFQQAINNELAAGLVPALVRAANETNVAAEMRAILENPIMGLNLAVYNTLSDIMKNYVAQVMINDRPATGYRNLSALAAMFETVVALAAGGGDLPLITIPDGTGSIRVIEMNITGTGTVSISDSAGRMILSHDFSAAVDEHMIAYINLPVGAYTLYVGGNVVGSRDTAFVNPAADRIGSIYVTQGVLASDINLVNNNMVAESGFTRHALQSTNTRENGPAFVALFDTVATEAAAPDSLISFGDSASIGAGWADLQFILRAGGAIGGFPALFFNAWDGYLPPGYVMTYQTHQVVDIVLHEVFHTKMEISLDDWHYDVWMAQAGEEVVQLESRRGAGYSFRVRNWPEVSNPEHNRNINRLDVVMPVLSGGSPAAFSNLIVLRADLVAEALDNLNAAVSTVADLSNITSAERDAFESALSAIALGMNLEQYVRVTDPAFRAQILNQLISAGPYANVLEIQSALSKYVVAIGAGGNPEWPAGGNNQGNLTVDMTALQQAVLSWDAAADSFGIRGYEVWRQRAGGSPELLTTIFSVTSFADSDISANTSYSYWVYAINYGNSRVRSNTATGVSGNAEDFGFHHDRYVLADAFTVPPARFHSRWNTVGRFPDGPQPPHPAGGPALWQQTEWYNPDYRMGEAMRYLTFIATNPDFHNFFGPDGQTTLLELVIQHFQSVLAGGNEPGVSGTGLAAHGYMPVLSAITHAKLNIPAVWDALTPEEIERADLLMKGALFAIYYAAADTGADIGLNQDSNYRRGWNINHRMGILAVPFIYYYFRDDKADFVGNGFFIGDADVGVVGWMNNFIRDFNYTVFTRQLQETGMTMLYNTFQNAGLVEVHRVAAQIRPEGMTQSLGDTRYHGSLNVVLSNEIGRWAMLYLNVAFDGGPVIPVAGDIWRTGGTGDIFGGNPGLGGSIGAAGGQLPIQRWPDNNRYRYPIMDPMQVPPGRPGPIGPTGFPHGYWGFFHEEGLMNQPLWQFLGADALNYFPNLGAPGMGQEFDTTDASGTRTCIGYVIGGTFGGIDGLLMLMMVSDDFGGLPPEVFNDIFVRANVGMIDLLFRIDNGFVSFCHGRQCGSNYMTGVGARMNMDLWNNLINNPADQMAAVNNASTTADMRTALENPWLGLVLHAYNGLTNASKDAVADAMLAETPFRNKYALQNIFSETVTEKAVLEVNAATTAEEMLAALDSPALGLWLFHWNQVTPVIPGVTDPVRRLSYAGHVLQNMPQEGFANRREVRVALATALNGGEELPGDGEWVEINGDHFFYINDVRQLGWLDIEDRRVFLNPETGGAMATGVVSTAYYGVHEFGLDGFWLRQIHNFQWSEGYEFFYIDGARHTGWLQSGDRRIFFIPEAGSALATGIISTGTHGAHEFTLDGFWIREIHDFHWTDGYEFFYIDGIRHTGWLRVADRRIFFIPEAASALATGIISTATHGVHEFTPDGFWIREIHDFHWADGFDDFEFFYIEGERHTGWLHVADRRIFFIPEAASALATGVISTATHGVHEFTADGFWMRQIHNSGWSNGFFYVYEVRHTGWLLSAGNRLYLHPSLNGAIATGIVEITNGETHEFNDYGFWLRRVLD